MHLRFRASLVAFGALLMLATPTEAPASAAAKHARIATCDQIPGVTAFTSQRWRLFRRFQDAASDDLGQILACRRTAQPARNFVLIGGGLDYPGQMAGDLVAIGTSGRYGEEAGFVIDLGTGRSTVTYDGPPPTDGTTQLELLGSGAIVPQTIPEAIFGAADSPASGTYSTAADGSVVRSVPSPQVDETTWKPEKDVATTVRHTFHARPLPGVRVTPVLGAGFQLEARRAAHGAPASLRLTLPALRFSGAGHASTVVARLAPGSASDLRMLPGGVIVARFASEPDQVRTHLPTTGGQFIDLPAPPSTSANPAAASFYGDTAVATADAITLVRRNPTRGTAATDTLPIPGATDLAITSDPDRSGQFVLYYVDATGQPQRYAFSAPA